MRRLLILLSFVVIAVGLAGSWALLTGRLYSPTRMHGGPVAPPPYVFPNTTAKLRLHVFNTGMNRMPAMLVGPNPPWRPAPAFVIEHPAHGLIVIDTGLSPAVARDGEAALPKPMGWLFQSRGVPDRVLSEQMRSAGLDPRRVSQVILTHLHADHIGDLTAFPEAQVIVGAKASDKDVAALGVSISRIDPTRGRPLPPFGQVTDLFGDASIILIAGGGHSHEDLLVLASLPGGPVLLTGDAAVHWKWLQSDDVEHVAVDPQRAADVRDIIRAAASTEPRLVVVPGHDLSRLPVGRRDIQAHHPEWFTSNAWPSVAQ
jgi:N-acyl homoserine lactone hydrolase